MQAMDQRKIKPNVDHEGQFNYQGRWVDKEGFRAFVYDEKGREKLVNSYNEFEDAITSGIWFESKPVIPLKRKPKDAVCADG